MSANTHIPAALPGQETCLLINPSAGRNRGRRLRSQIVAGLGLPEACVFASEQPGHLQSLATAAADSGYRRIVVAGGDGSIFEVVNGIMASASSPALGIIPVGTGNDFIKAAGIPLAWRDACRLIASSQTRQVDLGRCNGQYFANGVGIGLDAEIGHAAQGISWFRGPMVYLAAAFRTLAGGISAPEVTIAFDGGELVQRVTLVAVSNGSCYGGLFHIAPDASIADGQLDLIIADHVTRTRAMALIPKVIRGEHMDDPAVRYLQTREVRIQSATPLPVQIDGELVAGGLTDVTIEVHPRCLQLLS